MWIGRMVISVFFVAGYLTYYDSDFYQRLKPGRGSWQKRSFNTVIRIGIMLVVAVGLQLAALSATQGSNMYVNLLLFVTSYPLLDESTNIGEYLFTLCYICCCQKLSIKCINFCIRFAEMG